MKTKKLTIKVGDTTGNVSAELLEPEKMKALLVLAHGAGAGMDHRFMVDLAGQLAGVGVGTLRFNFPYMEQGKKRPDPPAVAEKTVSAAISKAHELYPGATLLAGGKSFGGRMTSQYLSKHSESPVKGIVFFGFPLHAPGSPTVERAAHLKSIGIPMLFLQGTRDALAKLDLIEEVCRGLSTATLVKFDGADHSFKSGKKEFIPELVSSTLQWANQKG